MTPDLYKLFTPEEINEAIAKANKKMAVEIKKQKKPQKHSLKVTGNAPGVPDEVQTAMAHVVQKNPDGSVQEQSEVAGQVFGEGPFANVGVGASRTVNLGNFENIKFQVSLHVPCAKDNKEILDTFQFAANWVNDRMDELSGQFEAAEATKKGIGT